MSKSKEDIRASRDFRAEVINRYGFVPQSVIQPNYSWGTHVERYNPRSRVLAMKANQRKLARKLGEFDPQLTQAYELSCKSVGTKGSGVSLFPPDLVRFVLRFYSKEGDTILDPMTGHNSRMQVAAELGWNYIGYDVCHEFMEFNRQVAAKVRGDGAIFSNAGEITLHERSSEAMVEVPDNSIDIVFTSPPYWDMEYYDDSPLQLGRRPGEYPGFLKVLGKVINECYRTLKPGKFCVWNVGDFRRKGEYIAYHIDIVALFRAAGFTLEDILIVKWHNSVRQAFASLIEKYKHPAKLHEYLIVGRKA